MSCELSEIDERFIAWLLANGARYPKLNWPATTPLGRGALAKEDIAPFEPILEIPVKLMMSPLSAYADEELGPVLRRHQELVRGDMLLAVHLMREIVKGESSFYYPYLCTLPRPDCLSEWAESDVKQLQDEALEFRAKARRETLKVIQNRSEIFR